MNRLQQLILDAYGQRIAIADYLLDLCWRGYSEQQMRRLLYRNLNQELWHAELGVVAYRELHAANAELIENAIFALAGSREQVAA